MRSLLLQSLLVLVGLLRAASSFQSAPRKRGSRAGPVVGNLGLFESAHNQEDVTTTFSEDIVQSLDLIPLMESVSRHAGTRRGRQSLLALVGADYPESPEVVPFPSNRDVLPARSRRLMADSPREPAVRRHYTSVLARNPKEAQQEYEAVAQAMTLLKEETYPPLYGSDSSPWDTESIAETDYDTWLDLSTEESTLEHLLQAEKVLETFQRVQEWATGVQEQAPLLAEIADQLAMQELVPVHDAIAGSVQISRVRTLTDPSGKSSFTFQLNQDKFQVIRVLRKQVEEAGDQLGQTKKPNSSREKEFAELLDNLEAAQEDIRSSLSQLVIANSAAINQNMNVLARLDILFAKAAFAQSTGGQIPLVGNQGKISVPQFVHPVLLAQATASRDTIVPIDLKMGGSEERALIISGPNGGGKTAAMKSFAMAALFCRLGLALPCCENHIPQVDFFHDIHVNLGDKQSLISGESTMMAQLNACSVVLEQVSGNNNGPGRFSMVLLDELGGGTDPTAGGAIAQAILEKLLEVEGCRVVATTHVPRLKTLSYRGDKFGCATVLLEPVSDNEFQRPAFQLLYGSIGDSHALGAASRSTPCLPEDVLSRAAQLIATPSTYSDTDGEATHSKEDVAYLQALTESTEQQSKQAQSARADADKYKTDTLACQKAMLAVASSYDRQFLLLERKLEDMVQTLQGKGANDFELVGGTLAELRLARKQVKSQAEMLKERGLKLLPDWQELKGGDTVVIVSEDKLSGVSATVVSPGELPEGLALKPDDVAVVPSLPSWELAPSDFDPTSIQEASPLVLKRSQLAIWDYDSVWEDDSSTDMPVTSVKDSKRKLSDILSTIRTTPKSPSSQASRSQPATPEASTFSSSRERKAAAKQSTKARKKRRKR